MANEEFSPVSPELVAYVLRAVQKEVSELRRELHETYLNEAQMTNRFVTRDELRDAARVRREWPLILATIVVSLTSAVNLVVVLSGAH